MNRMYRRRVMRWYATYGLRLARIRKLYVCFFDTWSLRYVMFRTRRIFLVRFCTYVFYEVFFFGVLTPMIFQWSHCSIVFFFSKRWKSHAIFIICNLLLTSSYIHNLFKVFLKYLLFTSAVQHTIITRITSIF